MGATTDLNAADTRWLTPLPLWIGVLAGPVAWALDLLASYALVKWTCGQQSRLPLFAVAGIALAITLAAGAVSWRALRNTSPDRPTDGGHPRDRARFMALLGLAISSLFALQILAGAIPPWVLDGCR